MTPCHMELIVVDGIYNRSKTQKRGSASAFDVPARPVYR